MHYTLILRTHLGDNRGSLRLTASGASPSFGGPCNLFALFGLGLYVGFKV